MRCRGNLHRRPRRGRQGRADLDFIRLDAEAFATAPNISVDYAVFEKTQRAAVLR